MKKQVFVLSHDYWHHRDTVEPIIELIFDDSFEVIHTTEPELLYKYSPDLFMSFKDPIENNMIPTPAWCDDAWMGYFLEKTGNGMGVVMVHAAMADLTKEHKLTTEIIKSVFVKHPEPCKVSFVKTAEHPVFEGIDDFEFPGLDEHYFMDFIDNAETTIIAKTVSEHGEQPGMWLHEYGKGRICCITPGHTTEILTYAPYVKLVSNAVKWCLNG